MNTSLYIAKRYLFSKKSHNIINIISGISVLGFTIGTTALIVILSVFNGFESVVVKLFNTFNAEIQITPKEGKTFDVTTLPEDKIKKIPGVVYLTDVIEENALLKYKDKQFIATIKGINPDYGKMSRLDTMIIDGVFVLQNDSNNYALVGNGVAYNLGLQLNDYLNPLEIYVPRRGDVSLLNPLEAFNSEVLFPSGVLSVNQEFDIKYILIPLRFAQKLLDYKNEVTSVELGINPNADIETIQKEVEKISGDKFVIKNRFQQQELLYKIMKSEKWAIILILSFILLVATFNIIGTLTMLILDKKKDITILWSLGADKKLIRKIFFTEGMMITFFGTLLGLAFGVLVCWLQQKYGFIKMPDDGTFVITNYPVEMRTYDFILVLIIDLVIGIITSWFPVRQISKRTIEEQEKF
ncbi:MAG TPA: FtsX-like permease family protein [Bacteroidales bacterium]|nr:FtsX-like permease family protein [Bacteroidales bacterium]HPS15991.1 FtsX-like permease family protein [Bacteroidales bacterium]